MLLVVALKDILLREEAEHLQRLLQHALHLLVALPRSGPLRLAAPQVVVHRERNELGGAWVLVDEELKRLVQLVDEALLVLEGLLDERVVLILELQQVRHILQVVHLALLPRHVGRDRHNLLTLDRNVLGHSVLDQFQPRLLALGRRLVDAREEIKHASEILHLTVFQQPHEPRPLLLNQRLHVPPNQLMLHHLLDPPIPRVVVHRKARSYPVLLLLQAALDLLEVVGAPVGGDEVLRLHLVEIL
mmetsp:Transcript_34420/g.67291  ORF Transcript_34420/g.67291 Transcript_34420/m.67291 type:complete len:245 (-) Transcript_34420:872-1606(-)